MLVGVGVGRVAGDGLVEGEFVGRFCLVVLVDEDGAGEEDLVFYDELDIGLLGGEEVGDEVAVEAQVVVARQQGD